MEGKLIVLLVILSLSLTLIAYQQILYFPFTFDDPIHLRWLEGRGVLEGWANARGLQHYRPLVLSVWVASGELFGLHNPQPLHLLSLLLHAANACMVGWLAYRMIAGVMPAISATVLFVIFPFSYQAMPSPGSQSKPLSAFLMLSASLLYWEGRSRHSRVPAAVSVLPALLTPFAYEAGVTVGGILLLMELLLWRKKLLDRPSPYVLLFPLVGLLFIGAWALVPKSSDPLSFPGWEALWQNSVYFAQALTWPLSLLARPLMRWVDLHDQTATTLVAYPSLASIACLFIRRRRGEAFLAYGAWYALALAVQWVILPFRYVIDGPRMLYPAAAGVAWLWADLLTMLRTSPHGYGWMREAVAGLALLTMAGWCLGFITERMELCRAGLSILSEASDRAIEQGEGRTSLFINLPSWVAPRRNGFALGHEGYTLLPEYTDVGLDDFVYANTGIKRELWVRALPDIRQQWRALIGYYGPDNTLAQLAADIRQADDVWVLRYEEEDLKLVKVGHMTASSLSGNEGAVDPAIYEGAVALREMHIEDTGQELTVCLHWRCLRTVEAPYTVFVHVYTKDGRLIAQGDGLPLGGTFPVCYWEPGNMVYDIRHIRLPESLPGEYTVGVGLYRSDTGRRASATDGKGRPLADEMFRYPVSPESH